MTIKTVINDENRSRLIDKQAFKTQAFKSQSLAFVNKIFKPPLKEEEMPSFTTGGVSSPDNTADISYSLRQIFYWMNPPSFQAMGYTTAFNTVQGIISGVKQIKQFQTCRKVNDFWGTVGAAWMIGKAIGQTAGGAGYFAYRSLSIISAFKGLNTPGVEKANLVSSWIGNIGFFIFYFAFAVACTIKLALGRKFESKLNLSEKEDNFLKFITDKITLTPEKIASHDKEKLKDEALKSLLPEIFSLLEEAGVDSSNLSKADYEKMVQEIFKAADDSHEISNEEYLDKMGFDRKEYKELYIAVKDLSSLEFLGLKQTLTLLAEKKELKLASKIGTVCVEGIKEAKASDLPRRLQSGDEAVKSQATTEVKGLLEKVRKGLNKNTLMNAAAWITLVAGVIGFGLGFISTGGILGLVGAAFFLFVCVGMHVIDIPELHEGLTPGEMPGKYDKALVTANLIVGIISLTIAVVVGSIFSAGLIPLLISVLIGVGWITCNSITLYKLGIKERRYAEENPTLQFFLEQLEKAKSLDDRLIKIFKHLPSEDKHYVKELVCHKLGRTLERKYSNFDDYILEKNGLILTGELKFGELFFNKDPFNSDVIAAVEKYAKGHHEDEVYGLLGLLKARDAKALSYIHRLSSEAKKEIFEAIYRKRAKHAGASYFQNGQARISILREAVKERMALLVQTQQDLKAKRQKEVDGWRDLFTSLPA